MSADLKVVSLQREGWREAVTTLRLIADQMESGEIEACSIGAMVMIYESAVSESSGLAQRLKTCRPWPRSGSANN